MTNSKTEKELIVAENQALYGADDGYYKPEVGAWAETKYQIVHMYNQLFATGMKRIWGKRVYIDLFAGAGKARIRNTDRIVLGSPLLALNISDRFDRYIFCDENKQSLHALRRRIEREYPAVDASFVLGDCNEKVDDILRIIPKYSKSSTVLSFCFVDPYNLEIEFETIRKLGTFFMDFLILLALSMDAKRNEATYVKPQNRRIEKFLGLHEWRIQWKRERQDGKDFRRFLAEQFAQQMISIGYRKDSLDTMIEMRSDEKNLPLYHLAFFSRDQKGYQFWNEVRKYVREPSFF